MITFKGKKPKGIKREKIQKIHITVTSALPYVNGVKHLGNLTGSLLPADIFHRFLDLLGIENIYICGTDEHGTQTEIAAKEEKLTNAEYSEKYYKIQKEIYEKWNFDFTFFGRSSSKTNHELTKRIFLSIYKNGYIKEGSLLLPFCKNCKKFLPDRFIEGICPTCDYQFARGDQCESCGRLLDPNELKSPHCNICKSSEIVFKKEKHLFLDLSKLQNQLSKWISKNKHWPVNTRNLALGWLREGIKPRCITRNLEWGVKVPLKGYEHLVFYVWFDAPIGYISITKDGVKDWKRWWLEREKPRIYHFLGKDNIPFHTVFWPGMLMASRNKEKNKENFSLPYFVVGYEYLNWESKKFSTSKHIGLFSDEALDLFPADYWRFYLSSILPEKRDSNFEWKDFQDRINNELVANYGNLFYRVTSFIEKNFGYVPKPSKPGQQEKELLKNLKSSLEKINELIWKVKLKDILKTILTLSNETNRYFQMKEPWFAIKDKRTKRDAATTAYYAVNVLRIIVTLLHPYMPSTSERALRALNIREKNIKDFLLKPGHKIRSEILFRKIDDREIEEIKRRKSKDRIM